MAGARFFGFIGIVLGKHGFDQLQIPVAVLVPEEFVHRLRGEVEAVGGKGFAHGGGGAVKRAVNPAIGGAFFGKGRGGDGLPVSLHEDEAGGIPQFVAEVAVAFDALQVKDDVAPHRCLRGEGEAQRVGAVRGDAVGKFFARLCFYFCRFLRLHHATGAFGDEVFEVDAVDDVEWVEHVSFGFGHFLSFAVAHQAVDIDFFEGNFAVHAVHAHQHHARDPEEDDVKAGNEDVARIECFEIRRVFRPALGGERPQRRGKPGIKHVFILVQWQVGGELVFGARRRFVFGDVDVAVRVVPRRDAVTPPQLARDAPVLQVFHPVVVSVFPVFRHELDAAAAHRLNRRTGQFFHAFGAGEIDEPLVGEVGLDDHAAAVAVGAFQGVRFYFFQQPGAVEVGDDFVARDPAVKAAIGGGDVVVQGGVRVHQVDDFHHVSLADGVVVKVVRGGDFHAAGAEVHFDVFISDDGDNALSQRHVHHFAEQVAVAFVIRMHGKRTVSKDGFRAGGGDVHILPVQPLSGDEGVTHVVHEAAFFAVLDFKVGNGGFQHRVPVHQALAAIDEAVFVQADEEGAHRAREVVVHGEALARPVERGAEAAQLLHDLSAGLGFPFPHFGGEGFTAEVMPRFALRVQLALDDHLCRDTGVVAARLPQGAATVHALVADERIHDGVLEGMPHVQRAGNVRRRNHDGVGFAAARGREMSARFPDFVPFVFDFCGLVAGRHAVVVHVLPRSIGESAGF